MREKIYKINVYEVECDEKKGRGDLINPSPALVKVKRGIMFTDCREAFTDTPLSYCVNGIGHSLNFSKFLYDEYRIILGVNIDELIDENLATKEDVDKYIQDFPDSEIAKKIKEYNKLPNLRKENKEALKKIKKAHDSGTWRKFI